MVPATMWKVNKEKQNIFKPPDIGLSYATDFFVQENELII